VKVLYVRRASVAALLLSGIACGGSSADSAGATDAGTATNEAGARDAGGATGDAGERDSGVAIQDAGASDAAAPVEDAAIDSTAMGDAAGAGDAPQLDAGEAGDGAPAPAASCNGPTTATSLCTWPGNKAGAITFTYDDGIVNSLGFFEQYLSMHHLKGTIGVIATYSEASQMGPSPYLMDGVPIASWDQINGFVARGTFDLCSHSMTHPVFTGLTLQQADYETGQSKVMIESRTGQKIDTFIYPHYDYDSIAATAGAKYYIAARTSGDGDPGKELGNLPNTTDYPGLLSWTVYHDTLATDIEAVVDQTINTNAWFIMTSHTVLEGDPMGWEACPVSVHDAIYAYVESRASDLWNEGFTSVAKYLRERETATVSTSASASQITVTLTDTLGNDALYNYPLTLKSLVPATWSTVTIRQGGTATRQPTVTEAGARYVYYDAVPGAGAIVIISGP
jgi:peptidoglycan/xylan/chitin deacetylase (PgdA/CDA1 family)